MKVRIYGTPTCTYCISAKKLCEQNSIDYEYIVLANPQMIEQLSEMIGGPVKTVPQIFINSDGFDEYIGGYDEFAAEITNLTL